jgi:transcriptional regulator with XRE-family HTH domain
MKTTQGGARLRDWLKEERRTQEWLGEQIGTHQTNISRWLHGAVPPLEMALKLRDVVGIEPEAWVPEPTDSTTNVTDDEHLPRQAAG